MYPPQRSGVRATMIHDLVPLHHPEWTTPRTRAMHSAKYRNAAATCDVVFVNSTYTGNDVAELLHVPQERIELAPPGVSSYFRPEGERADLGRPYVLTVATLEPRKNLETLLAAHRLLDDDLLLAVAGPPGWGPEVELERAGVRGLGYVTTRSWRGSTAAPRPSSSPPGSRASESPSSRRWRAARRRSSPRTRRWTTRAAARRSGSTPIRPRRSRRESRRRSAGAVSSSRLGSTMRARFTWEATGRGFPGGLPETLGTMRVGVDISAAGADAGGHGALPPRAAAATAPPGRSRAARLRRIGAGRPPLSGTRPGTRSACRDARAGQGSISCTVRRFAAPFRAARTARRHRLRPRDPALPGGVQPLDAHLQPLLRPPGRRAPLRG